MVKLHVTLIMLGIAAAFTHAPVPPSVSPHIDDLAVPAEEILHRFPSVVKVESQPFRAAPPQGRLVHVRGLEPEMLRVLVQMHGLRRIYVDDLPAAIGADLKNAGLEDVLPVKRFDQCSRPFALVVTAEAAHVPHRLGWERINVTTRAAFGKSP